MEINSPANPAARSCCAGTTPVGPKLSFFDHLSSLWVRIDKPILAVFAIVLGTAAAIPWHLTTLLADAGQALVRIAPWIALSVGLAAYATASSADRLVAAAFRGKPTRMITLAALIGAASPFCSCGVVPLIAGLLAAGVPLAPIMAFWLSSPLMDPTMFVMTAASLGMEFAVVKTLAAIAIGLFAGAATHWLVKAGLMTDVLRTGTVKKCCTKKAAPAPQWRVWQTEEARQRFMASVKQNGWFLFRWMTIAFLLESLMTLFLPAAKVTAWLGQGAGAIPAAIAIGIPSYLNGYAALPLVAGLIKLGMTPAVALAFLVAGGVTSVPAILAVWALVRRGAFALYLILAIVGSFLVSYAYAAFLAFS